MIADHRVAACNEAARVEGVRIGLRLREAQSRCPSLATHPHDPAVDEHRFAPVLAALERLVPHLEPLRPGLCAMRARGPARYYGDEATAAGAILGLAERLGFHEATIGIADGRFAAEQAARAEPGAPGLENPRPGVRIARAGGSAAFLGPLPVDRAAGHDLAAVLHGLGIRTLGALAALPEAAIRERFGAEGVAAHRRATGLGAPHRPEILPRAPAREFASELAFEPPIDGSEQLAFACVSLAEEFIDGLADARLVSTALRIELTDDTDARYEHVWFHPRHFTAADAVNRIRWQADAMPRDVERGGAGITRVRLAPAHADRASAHEPGLWDSGPDERVHHHLSRAQGRLGHAAVGTMQLVGGRLLADRQRFVPWGTTAGTSRRGARRAAHARAPGPWPGAVPAPAPIRVFAKPLPVELLDGAGQRVRIDEDDLLAADPARFRPERDSSARAVRAWSLPWAVRERAWAGTPPRFRLQVQLESSEAWLLFHEADRWFAEGRYD
nr:DNA polymerase Y family protein [Leucobacter weissii]